MKTIELIYDGDCPNIDKTRRTRMRSDVVSFVKQFAFPRPHLLHRPWKANCTLFLGGVSTRCDKAGKEGVWRSVCRAVFFVLP